MLWAAEGTREARVILSTRDLVASEYLGSSVEAMYRLFRSCSTEEPPDGVGSAVVSWTLLYGHLDG